MGRDKTGLPFSGNIEVGKGRPLDSRMLVEKVADLTNPDTFTTNAGGKYLFDGLIVAVTEDNNIYMLINADDHENVKSWKLIGASTINLSYLELVELRENSRLIPGCRYRITDYVTTTSQPNTQSAGHQFDIIVEATSEITLSENAKAVLNENGGYFDDVNLDAWEIKYCLENNPDRFAWADTENGKGVIYYMKDEWNNEAPYDFKNIKFYREEQDKYFFTFSWINNNDEVEDLTLRQDLLSDEMIAYGTHNNIIKSYYQDGLLLCLALNDIVFINTYDYDGGLFYGCYSNTFGSGCYSNTFGSSCCNNAFGNGCWYNAFGDNCNNNTFGNGCRSNTFDSECNDNTFNTFCSSNTFGTYCRSNTFESECYNNTFGDNCCYNTFDGNCNNNTFGDSCRNNTFCSSNTFNTNCNDNTFGNNCYSNTFGSDCRNNAFGDNCCYNTFGVDCCSNTFGSNCHWIAFYDNPDYTYKNGEFTYKGEELTFITNISLGNGCSYLLFYPNSNLGTIADDNMITNITVTKGVKGKSSSNGLLTLEIPVTNNEYELKIARNVNGDIKMYCEANLIK